MDPLTCRKETISDLPGYTAPGGTKPKVTLEEIKEKLTSLPQSEIELIATRISNWVVSYMGPVGAGIVVLKVFDKKGAENPIPSAESTSIISNGVKASRKEVPFFFQDDQLKFVSGIVSTLKTQITDAFSKPQLFIKDGISFQLSDSGPEGILKRVVQQTRIDIKQADVPPKYYMYLQLDQDQTIERSDLVFSLHQVCYGVEFSQEAFTITELRCVYIGPV